MNSIISFKCCVCIHSHLACTLTMCYVLITMICFLFLFFCHYIDYLFVSVFFLLSVIFFFFFATFFVFHVPLHEMCVRVSICLCIVSLPRPCTHPPAENQEVCVDGEAAVGGVAIPEINVTGVSGDRMPNGDSLRPRPDGRSPADGDMMGATSEVSMDPRGHDSSIRLEVRRQKSVRRMVENEGSGSASTGRNQY